MSESRTTPLLPGIASPADLRKLERRDLPQLTEELRDFLVESVSQTGGHFSSNLGTIELSVALHTSSTRRQTGWSGMSVTSATPTRSSPAAANA